MKIDFKDFFPPIARRIINRIFFSADNRKQKFYSTYEEALRDCGMKGYEDEELGKIILEKSTLYFSKLKKEDHADLKLPVLSALAAVLLASREKSKIKIIDFGGGGRILLFPA